ncbi:MAG: 2-methylaconitate cis-trans isomerase PrpF [Wenzhouxiangella sp.]|nr:MAG: 2-methylaconitate cis-trans isomerase PrpF [Wenzhouxiangella sp.]
MTHRSQLRIPATYMRGGTSKGVFFRLDDLPPGARSAGSERDALLLRVIGSPDPYGKHTDGMGGATSSTSKTVILSRSEKPDHDVDYLFGQVSIDQPFIDWSGNCGNLTAAVGSFAIANGLVDAARVPDNGICQVRIWQANIEKTIIAHVPISNGQVQETGDFELDGVTFPAAEVRIDFMDPTGDAPALPTGNVVDEFEAPGFGRLKASFISAGIPTIFVDAGAIGMTGTELQPAVNDNPELLDQLEILRAHGAVAMGLIEHIDQARQRQHTPKLAWVSAPADYVASSGKPVGAGLIDLNVRAMSMGKLHHAMMGTAAVAIAAAAAIPGTLVNQAAGGAGSEGVCFGHPSGTLKVGASVRQQAGAWRVERVSMSRSARILMEGWVSVPG